MFRLFVTFGALVVIALFTALIAPYFIDWTVYKRQFEEQASRIVGQSVTVGGEASVRLLPLPSISFGDLSVGHSANDQPLMTVDRFSARVELMPFLSGEIRVVEMELISPDFFIDVDEAGKIAWTNRQELPVNPRQIKLDRLTVRDASFRLRGLFGDADGDAGAITGEGIDANISAQSLYGPWQIEGDGVVNGAETRFDIGTGPLSERGTIRLRTTAQRIEQPYELSADGPVGLEDGILSWAGSFGLRPLMADGTVHSDAVVPLPVNVDGAFRLTPNRLDVSEYRMEVGSGDDPFVLSGKGAADLRSEIDFRMEVDGRQVDLDRIARMQDGEEAVTTSLEDRITTVRAVLDKVPVPPFKGEIDFEIPAIVAGDTLIREVSALVMPFGEGWRIARLEASLPGNTLIEADGRLGVGADFGFHGNLVIASRQPSGFASWATGRVDPAIRRLSGAGMAADVTLTENQTNLDNLELRLGGNLLRGQVRRLGAVFKDGERIANPALIADLSGDVVRLDDLRAISGIAVGGDDGLAEHDYDITLSARTLEAFELSVAGADVKFQYRDGELSVARLNIDDVLGAKVVSQGQIADLLQQPKGSFSLKLSSDNASPLVRLLRERGFDFPLLAALSESPELLSPANLDVQIESRAAEEGARSRVVATGNAGGTELSLRSAMDGSFSRPDDLQVDLSLEANNPNPETLFRQMGAARYGFSDLYGGFEGPAGVVLEAAGNRANGYSTTVSLNMPDTSVSARGLVAMDGSSVSDVNFDFTVGAADISPFVSSFGFIVPGMSVLDDVTAPLSAKGAFGYNAAEGDSRIEIIQGQLSDSAFTTSLTVGTGDAGRPLIKGRIETERFSVERFSDLAYGSGDVLGSGIGGGGGWSQSTFSGPVLAVFDAQVALSIQDLLISSDSIANRFSARVELTDGAMEIADVSAQWLGGNWSGRATLGSSEGAGYGEVQFAAEGVVAGDASAFGGLPNVLSGKAGASGTLEFSGRSPDAMISSLSGSGVVSLQDGSLFGIRESGLEEILAVTDEEGFKIDSGSVGPLVRDAFLQGTIPVETVTAPFSIAQGRLQMRNVTFGESARAATGQLTLNIAEGGYESEITISPDPGKNAVEGGEPEVSFAWQEAGEGLTTETSTAAMEGYLSIRAFEAEQRRVELLQASILEKQRLRYEVAKARQRSRWVEARVAEELQRQEEERQAAEEAARKAAEEKARLEAEAAAKRAAEEEAARQEADRLRAEEAARQAAEEEARRAEESRRAEEAARRAEEEALRKAEQEEAARKAAQQNANGGGVTSQPKEGFDVRNLPLPGREPPGPAEQAPPPKPGLFDNIEKFLFR